MLWSINKGLPHKVLAMIVAVMLVMTPIGGNGIMGYAAGSSSLTEGSSDLVSMKDHQVVYSASEIAEYLEVTEGEGLEVDPYGLAPDILEMLEQAVVVDDRTEEDGCRLILAINKETNEFILAAVNDTYTDGHGFHVSMEGDTRTVEATMARFYAGGADEPAEVPVGGSDLTVGASDTEEATPRLMARAMTLAAPAEEEDDEEVISLNPEDIQLTPSGGGSAVVTFAAPRNSIQIPSLPEGAVVNLREFFNNPVGSVTGSINGNTLTITRAGNGQFQTGAIHSKDKVDLTRSFVLESQLTLANAADGITIVLHNGGNIYGGQGHALGAYENTQSGAQRAGIKNALVIEHDVSRNTSTNEDQMDQYDLEGYPGDGYNVWGVNTTHIALHATGSNFGAQNQLIGEDGYQRVVFTSQSQIDAIKNKAVDSKLYWQAANDPAAENPDEYYHLIYEYNGHRLEATFTETEVRSYLGLEKNDPLQATIGYTAASNYDVSGFGNTGDNKVTFNGFGYLGFTPTTNLVITNAAGVAVAPAEADCYSSHKLAEGETFTLRYTFKNTNNSSARPDFNAVIQLMDGSQNIIKDDAAKITGVTLTDARGNVDYDGDLVSGLNMTMEGDTEYTLTFTVEVVKETVNFGKTGSDDPAVVVLGLSAKGMPNTYENTAKVGTRIEIFEEPTVDTEKTSHKDDVGEYHIDLSITGHNGKQSSTSVTEGGNADVVIVLDASNSMGPNYNDCWEETRNAAITLIQQLLPNDNPQENTNHVAVVAYSGGSSGTWSDGRTLLDLTNSKSTAVNSLQRKSLSNVQDRTGGGTNIQAGFMEAQDALKGSDSSRSQYVILLSDGAATHYYAPSNGEYYHYETNWFGGWYEWGDFNAGESVRDDENRGSYPNNPNSKANAQSQEVKGAGVTVYTIGLGNSVDTSLMQAMATDADHYKAATAENLEAIYTEIGQQIIEETTKGIPVNNAVVTDPMSQYVDLVDSNGAKITDTNPLTKEDVTFLKDGVVVTDAAEINTLFSGINYSADTETLTWTLPNPLEDGVTYTLRYNVAVDTTVITPGTEHPANGITTLRWEYTDKDGGTVTENTNITVPTVKQDDNVITIHKEDQDGNAMADVSFTVTGPNGYKVTKSTGTDGVVSFDGLYDYEYTVTETAPEGYDDVDPFQVDFAGKEDSSAYGTPASVGVVWGTNGYITIVNTLSNGELTIKKVLTTAESADHTFYAAFYKVEGSVEASRPTEFVVDDPDVPMRALPMTVEAGQLSSTVQTVTIPRGTYNVYETDENGDKLSNSDPIVLNYNTTYKVDNTVTQQLTVTVTGEPAVVITNALVTGTITINKEFVGDLRYGGAEYFFFDVQKPDGTTEQVMISLAGGDVDGSITISGLPLGTYTIREESAWRYELDYSTGTSATLTKSDSQAEATFVNRLVDKKWITESSKVNNVFGKNPTNK